MLKNVLISIRSTVFLWIFTAVIYPAILLIVGQGIVPHQANGSLITDSDGQVIGSALIGQTFTSDRYFWGRPSTINYSEGETAAPTGISGASNLAPDHPELQSRIQAEAQRLTQAQVQPTADLLYTSGSGLDPHISPAAAQGQIRRVAAVRSLSPDALQTLIAQHTDRRLFGLFGEPGVNVLQLNLALDRLSTP